MDGSYAALTTDPEKLARRAIGLLEKQIEERYGLRLRMGIELEYTIVFKPDSPISRHPHRYANPLRLRRSVREDRLFKESRIVDHGYMEEGQQKYNPHKGTLRMQQYEMVTDHGHPMPVSLLPGAIRSLREELLDGGNPNRSDHRNHRDQQQAWYNDHVEEIRFDSTLTKNIRNGMHLNISLEDKQNGQSITIFGTPLVRVLQDRIQQLCSHESGLLADTPQQRERIEKLGQALVLPRRGKKINLVKPGDDCYLENLTPGADSNPSYAILLQVAAIADALGTIEGTKPTDSLETILNELETDLGTHFMKAAQANPELKCFTGIDTLRSRSVS